MSRREFWWSGSTISDSLRIDAQNPRHNAALAAFAYHRAVIN